MAEPITAETLTEADIEALRDSLFGKVTVVAPLMALAQPGSFVNGMLITKETIAAARVWCANIINRRTARAAAGGRDE